jgi:8-oxo-dGTP diphosphatase
MEKHYTIMTLLITDETPCRALMIENRKYGCWMPPGGHQESNENPLETSIREVVEETGVDITEYLPKPVVVDEVATVLPPPSRIVEVKIDPRGDQPAHYHLDMLYVVHVPKSLTTHKYDEDEIASVAWLTLEEMTDITIPLNVRQALEQEMRK